MNQKNRRRFTASVIKQVSSFKSPRLIILLRIFLDHAVGGELRDERDHGAADALDPFARDALRVPLEAHRHDLLGESLVKVRAVHAVLLLDVVGMRILADGEAVGAVVAFAPPAVEDAQVHATVTAGFHAAGAGGLERTARVVQPDVATAHHLARDVDVVVLNEDEITRKFRVPAQMNDLLDEALALVVARMGLAGEDEDRKSVV